jgi:hypothetical protein
MNGIDGIIALCALLAIVALMLTGISEQRKNSQEAIYEITAKNKALSCAAIVDSIFSNTIATQNESGCKIDENKTYFTKEGKTKEAYIIGADAPEHYKQN